MMVVKSTGSIDFSFLNKSPDEIEAEFLQIPGLPPTYEDLCKFSEGLSPQNAHKNRYPDVIPSNKARVKLEERENDYINASHCLEGHIIISQGPKDGDDHHADFYHMLWTNDCTAIAMLTDYKEQGRVKCSYYLPKDEESKAVGEYIITALSDKSAKHDALKEMGIKITKIQIERAGEGTKDLTHYHFSSWEDNQGTAGKVVAALTRTLLNETKPVIQCSAGVGRSGTFAAVMHAHMCIKSGDVPTTLIPDVVAKLREERPGCVMNPAQYQTIYEAVKILVEEDASGDLLGIGSFQNGYTNTEFSDVVIL
jgi:protein tyrosine phosphatase